MLRTIGSIIMLLGSAVIICALFIPFQENFMLFGIAFNDISFIMSIILGICLFFIGGFLDSLAIVPMNRCARERKKTLCKNSVFGIAMTLLLCILLAFQL